MLRLISAGWSQLPGEKMYINMAEKNSLKSKRIRRERYERKHRKAK